MPIWWLADPRLLPTDLLRDEHRNVHLTLRAANGSAVRLSLLVMRHELVMAAWCHRFGKKRREEFQRDWWLTSRHERAVELYEEQCDRYYQFQVPWLDGWFQAVMERCHVPDSNTPWGKDWVTLRRWRARHGLDPNYYTGFDPLTRSLR
jgi:hypothetical protein